MAHVAELPGGFAVGSDASKAVAATPRAIRDFLTWLRSHSEPLVPEAHVSRPNLADISVMEVRTEGAPLQAGSKAVLFGFDQVAWDDEKLERTLRWLRYSRADLLKAIEGMSEYELKGRHIAPDRTLWDTLRHVANAEYGYINRVVGPLDNREPVTDDEPAHIMDRLNAIRVILVKWAQAVAQEKRAEITYPTWANRPGEPWTLQKALRRALEHELEHLRELR
ncbi:MAG TPA: DinB family protein [Chloroflexia bacterium]|nr:DinB family protein [Chloroflexia bacterium]